MVRVFIASLIAAFAASFATAQPIVLVEERKAGETFRIAVGLTVTGNVKTTGADGKPDTLAITATATHKYAERIDALTDRGTIARTIRGYTTCESEATLPGAKTKRILPQTRRIVVVDQTADNPVTFSPGGSLTRDELDVASHFDTTTIPGLLPGKAVSVGESWIIPAAVVQALCLFDGLTKHDLVGKLVEVKDGSATFSVEGSAEGVEVGATVKLKIALKGTYDLTSKRVTKLTGEETDNREQGPVAPACEVKAVLDVTRTLVADEPAELTAADRANVPAAGAIPPGLLALQHEDPTGKYQFFYSRDWHIVAATNEHLVMRLVDRGEFVAQATILGWKKAAPGQHASVAEIKEAIAKQPGWVAEKMTEDGEIPSDSGRWLYRLVANGKQDNVAVVQAFHLMAGPKGDQIVITVIARQEMASRIGTRDVSLINAIEMPKK
jgi:hypothetical protein